MDPESFTLDQSTGLPEIPEDCFWRVSGYRVRQGFYDPRPDEEGPCVFLIRKVKYALTKPKEVGVIREFFNSLFSIKEQRVEYEEEVEHIVDFEIIRYTNTGEAVHYVDITEERILAACMIILRREELRKKANALVGDYPPKKLEN